MAEIKDEELKQVTGGIRLREKDGELTGRVQVYKANPLVNFNETYALVDEEEAKYIKYYEGEEILGELYLTRKRRLSKFQFERDFDTKCPILKTVKMAKSLQEQPWH